MRKEISYRESHAASGYGDRYDANYGVGYYASMYRSIEVPLLSELFEELSKDRRSVLDFACGTGRITQVAVPYFEHVVGVDVSEEMLLNARKISGPKFVCQDITKYPLSEKFSVVTAFRFFLNAEDVLKKDALAAIWNHLDDDGRLICNIHMNSQSIMGIVYFMAKLIPGFPKHKTISYEEFSKMLISSGFVVEKTIWYGFTPRPGRFFSKFLDKRLLLCERLFDRLGLQGRFSHSFVVVAKKSEKEIG